MSDATQSAPKISVMRSEDIPVTNPHGISSVYANNIGVSATMLDFTIFFVETGQIPGENGSIPKNELKSAVTMPMPSAMAIMESLKQMLQSNADQVNAQIPIAEAKKSGEGSGLQ